MEYNEDNEEIKEEIVEDPSIVERALTMGFIPKDQFKGDPSKWRPASEFVKRADEIMPIMKNQLKKYEDTINVLKTELKTTKDTVSKVLKMSDHASELAYNKAKRELESAQLRAVADGNMEEYIKLKNEEKDLKAPEKVEFPAEDTLNNNIPFKEWSTENQWYETDEDARIYADAYGQKHPYTGSHNDPVAYKEWLNSIGSAVKKTFSHKFTNVNRNTPSKVDSSDLRGGDDGQSSKKKSYDTLPKDAKSQCMKYIAQGLYKTKEEYVKTYYEDDEE